MKPAPFDYVRAKDLPEALATLSREQGMVKLLAGGQSLGPMLNLRLARPGLLVDITRIEALRQIADTGAAWRIGAGVTHARIEDMRRKLPGAEMLCRVAANIAYRSIRNRGTIGGSLVHADPAADWQIVLMALSATVNVKSAQAVRTIPVDRFVRGAFTTELADNEIVESIEIPKISQAGRFGYFKFCRKTGEFAEANAAAVFDPERSIARMFVGAIGGRPRPLAGLAHEIAKLGATAASKFAISAAVAAAEPDLDHVGQQMGSAAVARALDQVFNS
jgi:aerobic carbon-monoxide dehydrogenase medium subunit